MARYPLKKEKIDYNAVNIVLSDYNDNSYYMAYPELFIKLHHILNGHITHSVASTLNMQQHKHIKDLMLRLTSNLPIEGHNMNERLYWILNDLHDFPLCQTPNCTNKVDKFLGLTKGYQKHCCIKCSQLDPCITQIKKNTTLNRHGDPNYRNPEKTKQTYLDNYGVDHPMKSDDFKQKLVQQHLEDYGCEWYFQSKEFQQRSLSSLQKHFGDGIVNPFQAEEVKQKIRTTWIDNYGVDNPSKDPTIKAKKKVSMQKTSIDRYGVPWPMQSPEVFRKTKRKLIYDGIQFDSFPEIAYFIWLTDNNIKFEYQPNKAFAYEFDGKIHYYHPDFFLVETNEIIEIKAKNMFENGKMINIYDRSQDDAAEAKHQCMLKNNVKILVDSDYEHCIQYVNQKFGKDFRQTCIKKKQQ